MFCKPIEGHSSTYMYYGRYIINLCPSRYSWSLSFCDLKNGSWEDQMKT